MKKCGSKITNGRYSFVNINLDPFTQNINKNEDNRIISECLGNTEVSKSNDIKIDLIDKIGAGTFGYIYSAMYIDNTTGFKKEVAVKKMVGKVTANNPKFYHASSVLEDFEHEVEYSIDMAEKGIGPMIYKAFYITDDNVVEEEPNYYIKYLVLFIVMEKFEYSLEKFIDSKNVSKKQKETAVEISMNILKNQIYNSGLYCIDIKPGNYVVNEVGDGVVVKMIDFGADYCKREVYELRSNYGCVLDDGKKDTLYVYCLLQMYEFLVTKGVSYLILGDPKFKEYFVKNRDANKDTVLKVYYEGSEQQGDQCHLVWFYGCVTMYYNYSKSFGIIDNLYENALEGDKNSRIKLAINMYDVLYHYIDEDIKKIVNNKIDERIVKTIKRSSHNKTPSKSTVLKIRSKIRSNMISKRRNSKKI